jgi:hypothetical protein
MTKNFIERPILPPPTNSNALWTFYPSRIRVLTRKPIVIHRRTASVAIKQFHLHSSALFVNALDRESGLNKYPVADGGPIRENAEIDLA